VWDATCVDTPAASHTQRSSLSAGAASSFAEEKKGTKYRCVEDRFLFQPGGFEMCGVFGPSALFFTREVGRRITERIGKRRASKFPQQLLSIAIAILLCTYFPI
jgi:hypothetical protein